jgi:hypothetical protein
VTRSRQLLPERRRLGGCCRFRITAPEREKLVTGYPEAERAADALAKELG